MPNISLTLPETSQSVTRPIIFDIINQVQEILKIDKRTEIFFPGEINKMQTSGTSIDSTNERFAIFNNSKYNFIEIEDDFDLETLGTTAVSRNEHLVVFYDEALDIRIVPIYATNNIVINFKYRCPSKTEALRWRDDIRIRVSQLRSINIHDATYHYLLPMELLLVLTEVYNNREATEGYGQTFEEYITSFASNRLTLIGDLTGEDLRLAISETQARIVGVYGFDDMPEKAERDDATGTWSISFSYKFSYEKPIGCFMHYPVMVHNRLLPKDFIDFNALSFNNLDLIDKSYSKSLHALSSFESDSIMNNTRDPNAVIRIPEYDDYDLIDIPPGIGTVAIVLSEVDTTDMMTLFNLKELGAIALDEDILEFIKSSEYPYICKTYHSIFQLHLYRDTNLISGTNINCNSDLNIKTIVPLNLRKQYRIRISLVTDISLLKADAIERLLKYPKAFVKIISAMNELLRNYTDFTNLGDAVSISMMDFNKVYLLLTGHSSNGANAREGVNSGLTGIYGQPRDLLNDNNTLYQGRINHATNDYITKNNLYGNYNTVNKHSRLDTIFLDIDYNTIEHYRNQKVTVNTAMLTTVIAYPLNN